MQTREEQPKNVEIGTIPKAQNQMLRVLTKTKWKDNIKIKDMLESTKMLSVNQTAAQIKLIEMWKVEKVEHYPIKNGIGSRT